MAKPKVVVLGGGFGGLETAYRLRKRVGDKADITIVSDRERFLFKPNTIYIPYGLDPDKLTVDLAKPAARKGIHLKIAHAEEIDTVRQTVNAAGESIPYDYLVVATGATMRPEEIPGLSEFAQTIWTPAEMLKLRAAYAKLLADVQGGARRQVLFLVPPNNKCSGPLYEMVFMLDSWLRKKRVRDKVEIGYTTYEAHFIQAFGPRLHEVVTKQFAERGITGRNSMVVEKVTDGAVQYVGGEELPFNLLITFPAYAASTAFAGLPADARGFIKTDLPTRRVEGLDNVYAVGDAADFPVKQAFLAFLQGDAASEQIAASILDEKPGLVFAPVSMCVMEGVDRATFAQVPLQLTGRPELPVEVRPDAADMYRVGTGKTWRLGKKALGIYLPWRFSHGEPFHDGLPWKVMEVALKGMSATLAK